MKKWICIGVLGGLLAVSPLSAQTVYDAANMASKDLNGTARFVGMGGAMGALGGDLSTIGTNPAGIGIYRSNDVALSFGFSAFGSESSYNGSKMTADKNRFTFDNAGLVFSTKIGNLTPLRYVNFAFNYHKAKSFYRNTVMEGNLGASSQSYQMAAQAAGIESWGSYPYMDDNIGWLSILGYDGWVISDLTSTNTGHPALDADNNQMYDVEGNPLYVTPGEYVGMYDNGNGRFRSEERGGIDQYDFNVSFNINDRVYLGLTVGAYAVDYNKYTFYDEDYGNGEGYALHSWNRVHGSGFDVKLGAIIRPFEYSPFRIGLAVHTPTFYNLEYSTSALMQSDIYNPMSGQVEMYDVYTADQVNGDMIRPFDLRTPWLFNVSLGYTVGQSLAIGVEYEYQDYSSMEFRDAEGYSERFTYENSTLPMLKGVSTVRLGLEYKVIPQFALRAGYNYRTALFNDDAYKDLPYYSIQTDTDFANIKGQSDYTLGIGYRGSLFYADLTYKYTAYKADFSPFVNVDSDGNYYGAAVTQLKNNRSQVLLTLGVRF